MKFFYGLFNKLQQARVMYVWLFFYLLVFLLPVIVDLISFQGSERIFINEIKKLNNISMSSDRRFIDDNIDNIANTALELSDNDLLEEYSRLIDMGSPEQIYALSHETDIWKPFASFSRYIKNMYVFFPKSDLLYYNNRTETPERYFDSYYGTENTFGFGNWSSTVLSSTRTGLKLLSDEDNKNEQTLFYVVSHQEAGSNRVKYNIIVEFNLNTLIEDTGHGNEIFYLCLPEGEIICTNDRQSPIPAAAPIPSANEPVQEFTMDNENFIVSQIKSQSGSWFYRCITPKYIYHSAMISSHRIRLIAAFISIVGGIMLIIWAVYSNNKPLNKLLQNISNDYSAHTAKTNEYTYINNLFMKNTMEKATYKQYILSNKNHLKQMTLSDLVDPKNQHKLPSESSLEAVGIEFRGDCFVVMLFYIKDCSNLFFETHEKISDAYPFANTIVTNIATEIINQFYSIEMFQKNDLLFGILNFHNEQKARIKDRLRLIFEEINDILHKEFNISLLGATSDVKDSASELPIAYNEAIQSIEYLLNVDKTDFIYYNNVEKKQNDDEYPYSNVFEMQIINNANMNHHNKNRILIETLFNNSMTLNNMPYQMVRYFAYDIIGTFLKIAVQGQNKELKEYLLAVDISSVPMLSHALLQKLKEVVNHCLDILQGSAAEPKNTIYDDIKRFVDEHYTDPNINVNSIADHFHINASQLSAQFKKNQGIGLLNYISQNRINMAKVMLTTTDMPIKQISAEIGYNSQQTFLRVFSKSENISPQKYRQTFLHEKK